MAPSKIAHHNPKLEVRLTSRWAYFNVDDETHNELDEIFSYNHPNRHFMPSYQEGSWDGRVKLFKRERVQSGLFYACYDQLTKSYDLIVENEAECPAFNLLDESGMRAIQVKALATMRESCGGIILLATASGKTRLAGMYFKELVGRGCFIVDEHTLMLQSRTEIEQVLGEKVGIIGKGQFAPERITVAMIQTLHNAPRRKEIRKWMRHMDASIIDELHLGLNKRNFDTLQRMQPLASFGLTATLQMNKSHVWMPATALTGPVLCSYEIDEGVRDGILCDGVIGRVKFPDPLRGVAPGYVSRVRKEGRWKPLQLEVGSKEAEYRFRVSLNKARNACIEAYALESMRRGRSTVILVEQRRHAQALAGRFQGITHACVTGAGSTPEERLAATQAMDAGKISLIIATRIFAKSITIKTVSTIIDATGLPGRNAALQRYGRGIRLSDQKSELYYIDIADVGNHFEDAAKARHKAWKETKRQIVEVLWKGNPKELFDIFEQAIKGEHPCPTSAQTSALLF